jgi:hypothetical protein
MKPGSDLCGTFQNSCPGRFKSSRRVAPCLDELSQINSQRNVTFVSGTNVMPPSRDVRWKKKRAILTTATRSNLARRSRYAGILQEDERKRRVSLWYLWAGFCHLLGAAVSQRANGIVARNSKGAPQTTPQLFVPGGSPSGGLYAFGVEGPGRVPLCGNSQHGWQRASLRQAASRRCAGATPGVNQAVCNTPLLATTCQAGIRYLYASMLLTPFW